MSITFGFGLGYCGYVGVGVIAMMVLRSRFIRSLGVIEDFSLVANRQIEDEKSSVPNWAKFSRITVRAKCKERVSRVFLNPMDLIGFRNFSESQWISINRMGRGRTVTLWYNPKHPEEMIIFKGLPSEQIVALFVGLASTGVMGYFIYECFNRTGSAAVLVGLALVGLLIGVGTGVVGYVRR